MFLYDIMKYESRFALIPLSTYITQIYFKYPEKKGARPADQSVKNMPQHEILRDIFKDGNIKRGKAVFKKT